MKSRRLLVENILVVAAGLVLLAGLVMTPRAAAQNQPNSGEKAQPPSRDRWLHVRVTNPDSKDESVRVNVPLDLAEKVLPTINHDRLHDGKIRVEDFDSHGVDVRALLDAIKTSKDGEFVTVQNRESDVRVAKQNGYLFVHVFDKERKKQEVEVKVPMKVVDALLSGKKNELDLVAGLRALAAQGDTELVSVKDRENTVRVWLDSKNISD